MQYQLEINKPKGTCHACGTIGKYRYFENKLNGVRLPAEYGRCDRENSCGYFKAPPKNYIPSNPHFEVVDYTLVRKSLNRPYENSFSAFLQRIFGENIAQSLILLYEIGSASDAKTVFWYKDEYGYYRNAKVYKYLDTGKRDKNYTPRYQFTKHSGYTIPIFGSHIIPLAQESSLKKIAVVESEKSAVIASAIHKDTVWLASGGSYMLTEDRCKRLVQLSKMLNQATIHLFADADESGRKGFQLAEKRLRNLVAPVVYHDLFQERNDGWDVADEILKSKIDGSAISV